MAPFIAGSSPLVSRTDGFALVVTPPTTQPGDIVIVAVLTAFPNGADLATSTSEVTVNTADVGTVGLITNARWRLRILQRIVTSSGPPPPLGYDSEPISISVSPSETTGVSYSFAAKAWIIRGSGGVTAFATSGSFTAAAQPTPTLSLTSPKPDSTAFMIFGNSTARICPLPLGPYGTVDQATTNIGLGAAFSLFQAQTSGTIAAVNSAAQAAPSLSAYGFAGLIFAPAPTSTPGGFAPAKPMRLGCAGGYDVFITRNDDVTMLPEIVDRVGWSAITWGRVLDDVSEASVDIPDQYGGVYCCAKFGGLRPWQYGLRIERDSRLVWEGPVVGLDRPDANEDEVSALRVSAKDAWARFSKRLAARDVSFQFNNDDAGRVFSLIVDAAQFTDLRRNGFVLHTPTVTAGVGVTREIVARDFEIAWSVLKDLLDSAVDGYVMNGIPYLFQPGTGWMYRDPNGGDFPFVGPTDPPSGELIYGLFTESAFKRRPGWSMSGDAQGTTAWEPGADSGEEGARRYWTSSNEAMISLVGELDVVDPNPLYRSSSDGVIIADETFQRRADTIVAQRALPPAVISGTPLSDDAPIDIDNLRPGGIWRMDILDHCYGQLLQAARLKRIDVSVAFNSDGSISEDIKPTLFPVGFTEADV